MIERLLLDGKMLRFEFKEENNVRVIEVDIPRVSYEGVTFYVEEHVDGAFYNYVMELDPLLSRLNKLVLSCIDFNIFQDEIQIY